MYTHCCTHTNVYTLTCTHCWADTDTHTPTHTHYCTHTDAHTLTGMWAHTFIHTDLLKHTHTHTYWNTRSQVCKRCVWTQMEQRAGVDRLAEQPRKTLMLIWLMSSELLLACANQRPNLYYWFVSYSPHLSAHTKNKKVKMIGNSRPFLVSLETSGFRSK